MEPGELPSQEEMTAMLIYNGDALKKLVELEQTQVNSLVEIKKLLRDIKELLKYRHEGQMALPAPDGPYPEWARRKQ